ncbi:MAG: phosphoglycerate dehydrogenase [Pirellulaceae bacterium]
MTHRIIVLDDLSADGLERLDASNDVNYDVVTGLKGDALQQKLLEYDGAICRSGVKITAESLVGNRRLKAIVRAGVGTDNIDKAAATRQGIVVMNTPSGNTVSTAEHTMALLLGLARNVAPAHASLQSGKWDRKQFSGIELRGKTLGIVGLGRIGQAVARKANAFEMSIVGFDPFLSRELADELNVKLYADVNEMLTVVDFLTVHTPLTPETKGLVNAERLKTMKHGVRLVNCARGGIYDESALVEGLKSGAIGGVALDVYDEEPCTDSPLFQMPNTLCTPHLGASTEEAQRLVALEAVELLVNFLTTGEVRHAVNAAAIDSKSLHRMKSSIELAYRLGRLSLGLHGGAISRCELQFDGDMSHGDTKLLSSAFCVGLLEPVIEDVNLINADMLLRERGIELSCTTSTSQNTFHGMLTANVSGDGHSARVGGTIIGQNLLRLVRVERFYLDAYIDGTLLFFRHADVPGIIGHVGDVLAKHSVNIGQMSVGRLNENRGGEAIGVLNLDSPPSPDAISEILTHPNVSEVKVVDLPERHWTPDFF